MTPEQQKLREAVARAMCIAHGDDPDQMIDTLLDDGPKPCWDFYYSHFANAAIAVALEEAAKVGDELEDLYATKWRAGMKCDTHLQGMSDGASETASRIRALIPSEAQTGEK